MNDPIADIEQRCNLVGMAHADKWPRSLQDLEGADWGDPQSAETQMIARVLALRRKPLATLTNAELRLAVGQRVGLTILLDIAVEKVRENPLLECDFYPGDLLAALVRLDDKDWGSRTDLRSEVAACFEDVMERPGEDADTFREAFTFAFRQR